MRTAKAAWERYIARNPPDTPRLHEVRSHLATDLR
jgi:hypothetical protein